MERLCVNEEKHCKASQILSHFDVNSRQLFVLCDYTIQSSPLTFPCIVITPSFLLLPSHFRYKISDFYVRTAQLSIRKPKFAPIGETLIARIFIMAITTSIFTGSDRTSRAKSRNLPKMKKASIFSMPKQV